MIRLIAVTLIIATPWLALCYAVAQWARRRSVGFGAAFILSFLLSPLIGAIIVALSPLKPTKPDHPMIVAYNDGKRADHMGELTHAQYCYRKALYELSADRNMDPLVRAGNEMKIRTALERVEALVKTG